VNCASRVHIFQFTVQTPTQISRNLRQFAAQITLFRDISVQVVQFNVIIFVKPQQFVATVTIYYFAFGVRSCSFNCCSLADG
jgi:hypothetical protein